MKKIVVLFVAFVMLASIMPIINANGLSIKGSIYINEPNILYGKYANIVENSPYIHIAGYPMLPYKVKTYIFPVGTKIKSIDVEETGIKEKQLNKKIQPAPQPLTTESKQKIFEGSIYSKDEFYPPAWFDYKIGVGLKNGKHVLFLNIYLYPYRYNAVENKIKYASNFNIEISYEKGKNIFDNDTYDLLIIAPDSWLNALQPLVNEKEQHGIKTKLAGLSECLQMNGRDDAEKVKYFIKNAIEQWGIKYVMLVGGRHGGILNEKWWVPVRYSHLDDNSKWEASYLSDLYFADIYKYENGNIVFDDWDSNGNGKFAEWSFHGKDILDLYPDVYVGRLACRNVMEVKTMVNKIIEYENSNAYEQSWFKKMILIGGDSYNDSHGYIEGELATWEAYKYMEKKGFEDVKVWASQVDLNAKTIVRAIDSGAGFAYFCGHGNPMVWSTHKPNDFNHWQKGLTIFDMPFLKNGEKLPVVVVGGCHNSQFNVSITNLDKEARYKGEDAPECWSWWLTRKINGGAIATIGNTALGYHGDEDNNNNSIPDYLEVLDGWLEINFFKNYGNGSRLGEIHSSTLAGYISEFNPMKYNIDCKVVQEWLLLGDPSLKID